MTDEGLLLFDERVEALPVTREWLEGLVARLQQGRWRITSNNSVVTRGMIVNDVIGGVTRMTSVADGIDAILSQVKAPVDMMHPPEHWELCLSVTEEAFPEGAQIFMLNTRMELNGPDAPTGFELVGSTVDAWTLFRKVD